MIVVYGKTVIDDLAGPDGAAGRLALGGGGPQAAFGARLWSAEVGLLSRVGDDFPAAFEAELTAARIDTQGLNRIPGPTLRAVIRYDAHENLLGAALNLGAEALHAYQHREMTVPSAYQSPAAIHLVTEFTTEPTTAWALEEQAQGAALSLEPIFDGRWCPDPEALLRLAARCAILSPDWPSACAFAGSGDPLAVMRWWARLGPSLVAVRHGDRGSYIWGAAEGRIYHIPVTPVQVIDPTGAGNAYAGGLCAALAQGADAAAAGCRAAVSAALLLEARGLPPLTPELWARAAQAADDLLPQVTQLG